MTRLSILIVDDDEDVQRAAHLALTPHARVKTLSSPDGIGAALEGSALDCVLLDMNFVLGERTGRAGLDGLAAIKVADPSLSVVLMTSYGGVSLAVDALKRGASDFLLKPWRNEALLAAVQSAADETKAARAEAPLELDGLERATIEKALARHAGNIAQAAAALGLSRPALYRRMSKHGL